MGDVLLNIIVEPRFYLWTRGNCWWCCCLLTLQASPRLWPLPHRSTLWYINLPVYVSYAHLLRKGVRSNSLVLFTSMCSLWMTKKKKLIQIMIIDYWNFGLSMNALTQCVVDSWTNTMTIKSWKHPRVRVAIIKVKISTNMNKENLHAAWAQWC